MSLAAEKCDF